MKHNAIKINNFNVSNELPFFLIAGPCSIESKDHAIDHAGKINEICKQLNLNFVYKSSFDKANRSSSLSSRGVGIDQGLKILSDVKKTFGIPLITDVHESYQCKDVANVVDIIQIPAFLCRQTDLLYAAAETNKIINVKKGQFLAPWDMKNVLNKIVDYGNNQVLLTERGTSFGYNTLVSDMRAIPQMSQFGYPIIFDATHSVQQPGGMGTTSGGQREFVPVLARAAISIGVSGLFVEVHENPDDAPSDGPNMLKISELSALLSKLIQLDKLVKTS
ncbi:3-deoxy-8-phosphooctulonate synthase [Alphaproteobacteria bacterium]|jgi:2-dehydro-3-deoxyphosphooctonate aldolase (KDO 8-P synthase)|nr:3-deoxy-8-phosphooctulonate synthase [Alphaproteobacteria bacterium]